MKDGKHVILYVDDDQDCLDSVRAVLEANGYVVVDAPSAELGLKVFRAERPDLVIADLMMEEVDSGTRFVKELQFAGCKCPIYMLSSVGDAMNLNVSPQELGLAGVFQKPLDPKTLIKTIAKALGT